MPRDSFLPELELVGKWLDDYFNKIENLPVVPNTRFGEVRSKLPNLPPTKGEQFSTVLEDFSNLIAPNLTHWQSPNFFAYFSANSSKPSVLGELLSAGVGVNGMLWVTSPAATELEMQMIEWLIKMMGLPAKFSFDQGGGGVLQDSGSTSSLCAIVAARQRATKEHKNLSGVPSNLVVYTTTETHSSIEKGVRIAGIGANNVRKIKTTKDNSMCPNSLKEAVENDIRNSKKPCMVAATVGTTSSTANDPLTPLGKIAKKYGMWFHVDAAHSGSAMVCPEFRHLIEGLEYADSYFFNAHKWLLTNFDCSCLFVANAKEYTEAFEIYPAYLKNTKKTDGQVLDYRNWQLTLGRRFRALKLWFVIRHYGVKGLQNFIREHVRLAELFEKLVAEDERFEVVSKRTLNLVCFRLKGSDEDNVTLLNQINSSGKMYITHTVLGGKVVLRMNISQTDTKEEHIRKAWDSIKASVSPS